MHRSNKQRWQVLTPHAVFVILVGPLDVVIIYSTWGTVGLPESFVPLSTAIIDGVCIELV